VELGDAEAVGIEHDHHRGVGHVHADLLDEVALFLDEDDQEFLLKG